MPTDPTASQPRRTLDPYQLPEEIMELGWGKHPFTLTTPYFADAQYPRSGTALNISLAALLGASFTIDKPQRVYDDSARRVYTHKNFVLRAEFPPLKSDPRLVYGHAWKDPFWLARTTPEDGTQTEKRVNFSTPDGMELLSLLLLNIPDVWGYFVKPNEFRRHGDFGDVFRLSFVMTVPEDFPVENAKVSGTPENGTMKVAFDGYGPTPAATLAVTAYTALYKRAHALKLPPFAPVAEPEKNNDGQSQ